MTIDERVKKMEGQLARLRWFNRCLIVCIVLSLVVGVPILVAWSELKAICSKRFILMDESGKSRALLGVQNYGPRLSMSDENGKLSVALTVFKNGPELSLSDENGRPRAILCVGKDGPGLSLYGEYLEPRAILSVGKDGPGLRLLDENGKTFWSTP